MTYIITLPFISIFLLLARFSKLTWHSLVLGLIWISFISLSLIPQPQFISFSTFASIDLISASIIILSFIISALIILARQNYILNQIKPKFFCVTTIALCFILVLAYRSTHLINFFIIFEASLIPTLILILSWGYQPERLQAGTYLILYIIASSLPLLFSILLISYIRGHLFLSLPYWIPPQKFYNFWWVITILPFLIKTPIYSLHLWLPKAHVEAPVSGSMILAGILLKLGRYGLFRLYSKFYFISFHLSTPILILRIWGACIASTLCLRQSDIKALIAYSSVRHIGLVRAGILSLNSWGWTRALLLIIAHGLISSALFSIANITYETSSTRNLIIIKGLINLFPSLTIWWFVLRARNLGAPPSINIIAEAMLLTATIAFSKLSIILLFFIIIFTTAYCLLLYRRTQYGPLRNYINPWNIDNKRNISILFIHAFPAIIFFTKAEIITLWI